MDTHIPALTHTDGTPSRLAMRLAELHPRDAGAGWSEPGWCRRRKTR
ncbi:hypothetical protein [Streptomyces sp. S186]